MELNLMYFLPGAFLSLMGAFNLSRALLKRQWPETIGIIQRNGVKRITSSEFNLTKLDPISSFSSKSTYGTDKENVLGLSYVYAVDGYKYIGSELYSAPIRKVRQRIADLSVGDKVKVFYHPQKPHRAFLAHSFSSPSCAVIALGLITLGAAAYLQIYP